MQILYLCMQWKPHSCILNIIIILTHSAKHGSKDLHLLKPHCQLNFWGIGINGAR